jgi:hypothetical protein
MRYRQVMLSRYRIVRGRRPPGDPLPEGHRQDTRKHTRHCLRPTVELVKTYLADPTDRAWAAYVGEYRALIDARFRDDRAPFDRLAELAMHEDVFLGCNCPTTKNPNVRHCHTWLALEFMQRSYPKLKVVFPG